MKELQDKKPFVQLNKKIDKKIEMLDKPRISKPITLKNARSLGLEVDKNSSLLRIAPQEIKIFGRKLFTINQEIKVQNGTKWLISGKNGCGKSVFLEQVIDNTIQVWKHPKLKIGYFSQCIVTESKDNRKVIDDILKTSIYDNTTTMQLIGDLHLRKVMNNSVATLSGGETIYYKLAKILLGKHNLLILDEPTNYLDIDAIQALENFLIEYPFSVIIVSHDQAFIKKSKFEIWKIKNKQFLPITEIKKESRNSELEILEFQLRQKLLNPEIPLSEINELKDKIQVISD
ncbi:ATP-binding cassette domain-containing protein [Lactobacillus mulieris]|uniref:ATP-binding cassette domain-containing protein n=1 Tax=Lactobacillus mulieris TaxID=2508708 RepID=A0AAW5WVE9_9LACO|nr:ATP-binding cassette domain-containing protein [Lactobacillus mulieris]MCZ3621283.1 ATP-binding cassette domain-containing protein [Lactobacillus mulieris]MCZ3624385.1 ATP-binding cassette domain-containing protein [Lactobacillus mulieris]MCZ3635291.1 ATP-binding cassette domain-containing protein [Lactobacillus mulieris]MCZ3689540.1 ATP-binding cassette domain-containing protein [Lactobacillus mulieris]MCZ3695543.1 ATP-binding cassette domain-containing protein [Lactobacillus mulieris]